jgi:ABC-type uncharacterized transport system permease subunit
MEKKSDLRDELLKQMDRDAGGGPNASQKAVQTILTKDAARLRRVKYLTVSSWLLLAAAFLASGVTGALSGFRSELWGISSIIGLQALLIIAVAFTVVLSVRARTLKMKQIQAALADIQGQLKAMSVNSGGRPEV